MTKTEAQKYRAIIEEAVQSLDDDMALECATLFPKWEEGKTYPVGTKLYNEDDGNIYVVLQEHTSQADWTLTDTPSLYAKLLTSVDGTILEWEQPDSTNPYMQGDKVTHNGKTWISTVDYNVWEPGIYGWDEVEE